MNSPFVRIEWNKYETALLINAYESVVAGEISRKNAVSMLSERLRNRMILHGIEVSDKYRNTNGIELQMSAIEYCLTNGEKGVIQPSQLFKTIARLATENREQFELLLQEALQMYPEPVKVQNTSTPYIPTLTEMFDMVEQKGQQYRQTLAKTKDVLYQRFPKGFRLKSSIELKRFKGFYAEITDSNLEADEASITDNILACGISYEGKVYLPELMLSKELKKKIANYTEEVFASGRKYLFYEVLYRHFRKELLDSQIADAGMLRAYLQYYWGEKWYFFTSYLTVSKDVKVDIDNETIDYVREQGRVVTENEVAEGLSNLPEDRVRQSFNTNADVLISNGRNQRFHSDMFIISAEELGKVASIIDEAINGYTFITTEELIKDIKINVPALIENNSSISDTGIRNVLSNKLAGKFQFNGNVISRLHQKFSSADALLAFCRNHREFSLAEADQFAGTLGTVLNYHLEKMLQYSLRVDNNTFIARDRIVFDVEATDNAIANYCVADYIPIGGIDNFAAFPECGYVWNLRLLESYCLTNSEKFTLLHSDYLNKNNVSGAIVKRSSPLQDFKAVLTDALASSAAELSEACALKYLADEGYIVQRRYSDIEQLLIQAKELRNKINNKNNI